MGFIDKLYEIYNDKPDPHFALQGTINWMAALRVYCQDNNLSQEIIKEFYSTLRPSNSICDEWEVHSYENLCSSIHNLQALKVLSSTQSQSIVSRTAIVTWYYCIYYNVKAMISARTGIKIETHAKASKIWQTEIANRNLIMEPFSYNLKSLIPKEVDSNIENLKEGNFYDLNSYPINMDMAKGALISYLKGSAKYYREQAEVKIKKSREFKELNVDNFRTKKAQELRDNQLEKSEVNFVTQSFRYRGKANYRDAIYLTFQNQYYPDKAISNLIEDLVVVAEKFTEISLEFVEKCTRKSSWDSFMNEFKRFNRIDF